MKRLKKISKAAVPSGLEMAHRYRMLNEPSEAESICRDVLEIDPNNYDAQVTLLLSLSDQFSQRMSVFEEAQSLVDALKKPYDRNYYSGVLCERRARAHTQQVSMGSGYVAYDWYQQALQYFDKAAKGRPKGNDKAYFRWNAVIRALKRNHALKPYPQNLEPQMLE